MSHTAKGPVAGNHPPREISFAQLNIAAHSPVILEDVTSQPDKSGYAGFRAIGDVVSKTRQHLVLRLDSVHLDGYVEEHALRAFVPHPRHGLVSFQVVSAVVNHPLLWLEAPANVNSDRALRAPYVEEVVVETDTFSLRCRATNLSAGGICVRLPTDPPLAHQFEEGMTCRIYVGLHVPLRKIAAKLVWLDGGLAGFNFVDLTSYEEDLLVAYTNDLELWKRRVQSQLWLRTHST